MEIKLAKTAGFCFGVKRAVDTVYKQVENGEKPIFTYGPIIHNEEVVKDLEEKGVKVINTKEEILAKKEGTVIIRSHGVSKDIYDAIEYAGLTCVDATCPFVKKIHKIVEQASEEGKRIIIIGTHSHPEVEGIKGWSKTPVTIIKTAEEAEALDFPSGTKVCIVSQTTFNYNKFQELVEILGEKSYDKYVYNTICNATQERQVEARRIAVDADAMIVIGGRTSSNTQKLYEICKEECENTYYIQTLGDLDMQSLQSIGCVGITAGASTPQNIIEEVLRECQN